MTVSAGSPANEATPGHNDIDTLSVNTIRTLAMDAVQKANSGHPGAPMALAPVGYEIWQNFLRYDPKAPHWPNRDRFVLSNGHACMLLYSLIHLTGIHDDEEPDRLAVTLDDIKGFRQLDGKCPGHPEYTHTTGVETTTGPLGQGVANSVGIAIAERWFAARYNRPGYELFDWRTVVICGDGDMMEGVSSEAASLAGHLRLSNLVWLYDNNTITIEGHTALAFSDDVAARFRAYHWNVAHVSDANDRAAIGKAMAAFADASDRPTLIVVDSIIAYGAPHKANTKEAHGEPLGADEVKATKAFYGWPEDAQFLVPDGVREHFAKNFGARGEAAHAAWEALLEDYGATFPAEAAELKTLLAGELPAGWDADLPPFPADPKGVASRDSSGKVLNAVAANIPYLLGGAADLAPSTKTKLTFEGAGDFEPDNPRGRNMHFGIREHAMGSIANGMAVCGLRPYVSGFLIFSDYMKPPMRLASIMRLPVVYIFTHDSIGVGEDGPTHQPIEQLAMLRSIPGMVVLRPADANEVTEAWRIVLAQKDKPHCLILSRQPLATADRSKVAAASGVAQGGYILAEASGGTPKVILIGTGSEVQLCLDSRDKLEADGVPTRVVSMPSFELFDAQPLAYRQSVLPPSVRARVGVEQAGIFGWDRYVGPTGAMIGMHTFGASAPLKALLEKFGFSVEKVVERAKAVLAQA